VILTSGTGGERNEVRELYDLIADPKEASDLAPRHLDFVGRMTEELRAWQRSVERSLSGADYR